MYCKSLKLLSATQKSRQENQSIQTGSISNQVRKILDYFYRSMSESQEAKPSRQQGATQVIGDGGCSVVAQEQPSQNIRIGQLEEFGFSREWKESVGSARGDEVKLNGGQEDEHWRRSFGSSFQTAGAAWTKKRLQNFKEEGTGSRDGEKYDGALNDDGGANGIFPAVPLISLYAHYAYSALSDALKKPYSRASIVPLCPTCHHPHHHRYCKHENHPNTLMKPLVTVWLSAVIVVAE